MEAAACVEMPHYDCLCAVEQGVIRSRAEGFLASTVLMVLQVTGSRR